MTRRSYGIGDWIAVPLRESGFAVGLIARASEAGVLLGYFFGPKRVDPPTLDELTELTAADAALVRSFGHLGLTSGKWVVLGRLEGWDPKAWPMPKFVRYEELTGRSIEVTYDDQDPNQIVHEHEMLPGPSEQLPKDGLLGAGAAEKLLTSLLG